MSKAAADLDALLDTLCAVEKPMPDVVRTALKVDLVQTSAGASFDEYEGKLPKGPIEKAELRFVKARETGLLILRCRPTEPVLEWDLKIEKRGAVTGPQVNPDIPPEGTAAVSCALSKTRTVTFTHTMKARRLLHVTFGWVQAPPPPAKEGQTEEHVWAPPLELHAW